MEGMIPFHVFFDSLAILDQVGITRHRKGAGLSGAATFGEEDSEENRGDCGPSS